MDDVVEMLTALAAAWNALGKSNWYEEDMLKIRDVMLNVAYESRYGDCVGSYEAKQFSERVFNAITKGLLSVPDALEVSR